MLYFMKKNKGGRKKVDTTTNDYMFNIYMRECRANNLTDKTLKSYLDTYTSLKRHFPGLGEESFAAWDPRKVNVIKHGIAEEGLAPATRNSYLRTLKAFLRWGMRGDFIQWFEIKLVREPETYKNPYTDEELRILLRKPFAADDRYEWRNWAIVNFLIGTGVRGETVSNVRLEDVTPQTGLVITRHNKNGRIESLKMGTRLRKALIDYQRRWDGENEGWLFCDREGGQLTVGAIQQAIRKYNEKRGIKKYSIHLFRHTFARRYAEAGGDVFTLQRAFGHKDIKTTQRYVDLYGSEAANRTLERLNPLETL